MHNKCISAGLNASDNRSPVVLAVRFWSADDMKDGGTKRSAQINEAIKYICPNAKIEELVLPISARSGYALRTLWSIRYALRFPPGGWRPRRFLRVTRDIDLLAKKLDEIGDILRVVIWEATASPAPPMLKRCPVLAFPHNIEANTLMRKVLLGTDSQRKAFDYELGMLARADYVIAISSDEKRLLRDNGIKAYCLPYYPPEAARRGLEFIRQQRQQQQYGSADYLVLGSATNPVTAASLAPLLLAVSQHPWRKKVKFTVCGNGTEKFQEFAGNTIEVLGRVTNETLNILMLRCDAAIVYQEAGSGLLTRIREYMTAGVPVIANRHAARGYPLDCGLYVTDDLQGLLRLVNDVERFSMPDSLGKLENDWSTLVSNIKNMLTINGGDKCPINTTPT